MSFSPSDQPAATRRSDLRPVCGGRAGELWPPPRRPVAPPGEGDRPGQLRRRASVLVLLIIHRHFKPWHWRWIFLSRRLPRRRRRRERIGCSSPFSPSSPSFANTAACWSLESLTTRSTKSGVKKSHHSIAIIKKVFSPRDNTSSTLTSPWFPTGHVEAHLRYPHCWVWLTSSQLFGQLFAAHKPEDLVTIWKGEATEPQPLSSATTFITGTLDKKVKQMGFLLLYFHLNWRNRSNKCFLLLWCSDAGVGLVLLPTAAVQVPWHGIRRAGAKGFTDLLISLLRSHSVNMDEKSSNACTMHYYFFVIVPTR